MRPKSFLDVGTGAFVQQLGGKQGEGDGQQASPGTVLHGSVILLVVHSFC